MDSVRSQLTDFWQKQSRSQRIAMVSLSVAAVILAAGFIVWATTPTYSVAYRGLSESDAGEIVQKLQENKISYKIEGSGTILVESNQVYEARMRIAREGLPKSSTVGMELFSENMLGMTEFTQKVNWQRAMEGELERTIGSMDSVQAVRVHIVTPEKALLSGTQNPTTASITIEEKAGYSLDASQVRAITHLVGSAVEGLSPENVVVVDTAGNMLAGGGDESSDSAATSTADAQHSAEASAANEVKRRVEEMLQSVLGPNRSVVQATVQLDWTQRETTAQTYDPTPAAIRSSQKVNEAYTTDGSATGGIPGAASNLPTPVATLTTTTGDNGYYQRSEETLNYEITRVDTHEVQGPGQIERVSVSVLVDGVTDQAQLDTLKAAVSAAAGIDDARGDTVVVEALAFDRTAAETAAAELEEDSQMQMYITIGVIVAVILLAVLLLWYVSRLFRNLRIASNEVWTTVMKPVPQAAAFASTGSDMPMIGGYSSGSATPAFDTGMMPMGLSGGQSSAQQAMSSSSSALPEPIFKQAEVTLPEIPSRAATPAEEKMIQVLTKMTEDDPATIAEIIQLWLSQDEK